jgi:hypothetical protein
MTRSENVDVNIDSFLTNLDFARVRRDDHGAGRENGIVRFARQLFDLNRIAVTRRSRRFNTFRLTKIERLFH